MGFVSTQSGCTICQKYHISAYTVNRKCLNTLQRDDFETVVDDWKSCTQQYQLTNVDGDAILSGARYNCFCDTDLCNSSKRLSAVTTTYFVMFVHLVLYH